MQTNFHYSNVSESKVATKFAIIDNVCYPLVNNLLIRLQQKSGTSRSFLFVISCRQMKVTIFSILTAFEAVIMM